MNSLFICCLFFVGFSVLQCSVVPPENPDQLPEEHKLKIVIESQSEALNYMLDVNDDIRDFLSFECNKLRFSMEQITILGKSIQFLALGDNEMLQLQPLHSYLQYTNGVCDDLHNQMFRLADGRYDQYIDGIPYDLSAKQTLRLKSSSKLERALGVTDGTFSKIRSLFANNETRTAMKLAELKKLKISAEIIKLSSSIKEIELGIEPLLSMTKIKNDFLKAAQEMAGDLEKHVEEILKFDHLIEAINNNIESIANAQKGLPLEIALSFIV